MSAKTERNLQTQLDIRIQPLPVGAKFGRHLQGSIAKHHLEGIFHLGYILSFDIEFTEEYEAWWDTLGQETQESIMFGIRLLAAKGPTLPFPYSSKIRGSRHRQMRALRIQHGGLPYRVFYLFDPGRIAVLLIGGIKDGSARGYQRHIKKADRIYDVHLANLDKGS